MNPNIIIPSGMAGKIETKEDILRKDYLDLRESMLAKKPVPVRIFMTEEQEDTNADMLGLFAVGTFGPSGIKIKIPAEHFIPNLPKESVPLYKGASEMQSPIQFARRYLNSRLGGDFDVLIQEILPDETGTIYTAYASRLAALAQSKHTYYFSKNQPCIEEGSLVYARITGVFSHKLEAEVGGIECVIPGKEVAYTYLPDLRGIYELGQIIVVKVTHLVKDLDQKEVLEIEVSKKDAEDDPRDALLLRYKPGDTVIGEVVYGMDSGCLIALNGGEINCSCPFPKNFARPEVGTRVIVKINKVSFEDKRLYGFIKTKTAYVNR